jgi:type IV fimbrial biogenesis protein FimT
LIEVPGREIERMKTDRGYTLVEIMVAIAIVAILATIAVPNISGWRAKQRFAAAVGDVHEAIKMARSSAIKNNANVVVQFQLPRSFRVCYDDDKDGCQDADDRTILSGNFQNDINIISTGLPNDRLTIDGRGLTNASINPIKLRNAVYGDRHVWVTVTGNSRIE